MEVKHFFHQPSSTLTYVIFDRDDGRGIVIDPVLDFDPTTGIVSSQALEELVTWLRNVGITPCLALDTHIHADHFSGVSALKHWYPDAKSGISVRVSAVIDLFAKTFDLGQEADPHDQFDLLLNDHVDYTDGPFTVRVLPTPGHTPSCTTFQINDFLFTGDAIFMPDFGTGRCDFPGGSAVELFKSIALLYALPDATRIFVGHDYQPQGRELCFETTVGQQKAENVHINASTSQDEFVRYRTERDSTLMPPKLLHYALQVNLRGGRLPLPDEEGCIFLRLPIRDLVSGPSVKA